MKRQFIVWGGILLFGTSAPAFGQSSNYELESLRPSVEARLGINIPFGGNFKKAKDKPQISLGLRGKTLRKSQHDWTLRPLSGSQFSREVKLALTLEDTPALLLNDQHLSFEEGSYSPDGTLNALDTYDKTVLTIIGVSVAVIAGSIIIVSDD